jgi:hypothetical protein
MLGNGKTNSITETLAKRAGGDFNTISIMRLGMTWCDAA